MADGKGRETGARDDLLVAAVAYVGEHGVSDLSLRALAQALGTSHRMLSYHFGSKQGLFVEIVRAVEDQQRGALADLDAQQGLSPAERAWSFWRRLADPSLAPNQRLFFEIYGQALQGRPHTTQVLDGIVETWLGPVIELGLEQGKSAHAARVDARLGLAVVRGLLLDLLATGDREGVEEAMERFISWWQQLETAPAP